MSAKIKTLFYFFVIFSLPQALGLEILSEEHFTVTYDIFPDKQTYASGEIVRVSYEIAPRDPAYSALLGGDTGDPRTYYFQTDLSDAVWRLKVEYAGGGTWDEEMRGSKASIDAKYFEIDGRKKGISKIVANLTGVVLGCRESSCNLTAIAVSCEACEANALPVLSIYASTGSISDGNISDQMPALWIYSYPPRAEVYINGIFIGFTPISKFLLEPGLYVVKFKKRGYHDCEKLIDLTPGKLEIVNVTLPPIATASGVDTNGNGIADSVEIKYFFGPNSQLIKKLVYSVDFGSPKILCEGQMCSRDVWVVEKVDSGSHEVIVNAELYDGSSELILYTSVETREPLTFVVVTETPKPTIPVTQELTPMPSSARQADPQLLTVLLLLLLVAPATLLVKRRSKGADYWNEKGNSLYRRGKYEEALKCYEKALEIDSKFAKAWNNRGYVLAKMGRKEEAVKCYQEALKIDPNYFTALKNLGDSLYDLGRVEEAMDCYSRALELNPKEEDVKRRIEEVESQAKSKFPDFPRSLLVKYIPLDFLGEGGFAKVFRVKRKSDGAILALKIPIPDEKARKVLMREIEAWKALDHPNIVKLINAYEEPVPHLELEFVEGFEVDGRAVRDLSSYPKPAKEEEALRIVKGIAEGLRHAHSRGVYHRDLKPQNVLLTKDATPKITDWGLAKVRSVSASASTKGLTLSYAAPEQLDSETYGSTDHRTDIYQLGLIFYELLTGKLPYATDSPAKVMFEILRPEPFEKVSKVSRDLEKFDSLISRATAKRKEERYQSVEELLRDLTKVRELSITKSMILEEIERLRAQIERSRDRGEVEELRKKYVEKLCENAVLSAKLDQKSELISCLEEIMDYAGEARREIEGAVRHLELMIREGIRIGEDFVEAIKVVLNRVRKEYE